MNYPIARVLILWTHTTSYLLSGISQLLKDGVAVDLVGYRPNETYPSLISSLENHHNFHFYQESDLPKLKKTPYNGIIICGWRNANYLKFIFKRRETRILYFDNHFFKKIRQIFLILLSKIFFRYLFNWAFVPGEPQKHYARLLGFPDKRIMTGALTYDNDIFSPSNIDGFDGDFIYVGRISEEKGLRILAEAFELAQSNFSKPRKLIICGPAEDRIIKLEMEKFCYLNYLRPEELSTVLKSSFCFVLPSTFEPWGVSAIEAAGVGLPLILSTQVGSHSKILDKTNGILFTSGDASQLAKALIVVDHWDYERYLQARMHSLELSHQFVPEKWSSNVNRIINGS